MLRNVCLAGLILLVVDAVPLTGEDVSEISVPSVVNPFYGPGMKPSREEAEHVLARQPYHAVSYYTGGLYHPSSLATEDGTVIVTWSDNRTGYFAIYGVIMAPDGAPITEPFRLSESTGGAARSSIAFDGTNLGVVWESHHRGYNQTDLYFQKLSLTGERIGGNLRLTQGYGSSRSPYLRWVADRERYAILWVDNRERYQGPMAPSTRLVTDVPSNTENTSEQPSPDDSTMSVLPRVDGLRFAPTGYFGYSVLFATITRDGEMSEAEVRVGKSHWSDDARPTLVYNGTHFGALFVREHPAGEELVFRLFDADGFPRSIIQPLHRAEHIVHGHVYNTPSGYLIGWATERTVDLQSRQGTIHFAALDASLDITRTTTLRSSQGFSGHPYLAPAQDHTFRLVYVEAPLLGEQQVYTRLLKADLGAISAAERVSDSSGSGTPSIAGETIIWNAFNTTGIPTKIVMTAVP